MRVVIVEDNFAVRESLNLLLDGESNINVTGSFSSGEETLEKIDKSNPEVMLVDLGLPGISGIDLIRKIKKKIPSVEILAHTVSANRNDIMEALRSGASGYILKGSTPRELLEALYGIYQGDAPLSPRVARTVIGEIRNHAVDQNDLLTIREKEVLIGLEKGLSYKEIASHLNISPHTVHSHIKHIHEKLESSERQEVFRKARRLGIL
jgi:two-component system NarL family response regulator